MPIYEYWCSTCTERVEIMIRGDASPICPSCEGEGLERMISLPHFHSGGARALHRKTARKQAEGESQERVREHAAYEREHEHP